MGVKSITGVLAEEPFALGETRGQIVFNFN